MPSFAERLKRRTWQEQRRLRQRLELLSGALNIHFNRNVACENAVVLSGPARSGTTWATDAMNYDNEFRFLCEPFLGEHVRICKHFKFLQYLPVDSDDPRFLDPVTAVLSGRVRDAWIDRRNRRMIADRRLVKAGRSGLMLGWMRRHFPDTPIVLLLRHPVAVVNSRLQLGWRRNVRQLVLSQDDLVRDFLQPFLPALESAKDDWENGLYYWCVETFVPLRQLRGGDVYVLFYEHLASRPRPTIESLFAYIGKTPDERVFQRLHVPSVQARVATDGRSSAILAGTNLVEGWRRHVLAEQVETAMRILSVFGLDRIYGETGMPKTDFTDVKPGEPLLPA
jgi:hypothetical protein